MKTLYVTDLDGTLLTRENKISEYITQLLTDLLKKGLSLTYATARSLSSASVVTKGVPFTLPVIVYNGGFLADPVSGEWLHKSLFKPEQILEVSEVLTEYVVSPLVYSFIGGKERVSWLTGNENDGLNHYLKSRKGDRRFCPLTDSSRLYDGEVFYFTCIGEKNNLSPVYEFFQNKKRYRCCLTQELYRDEYWCEIMPEKTSKAFALKRLKERLGFDRIVSFGDSVNDLPLFFASDECYAVENAAEKLKQAADGVLLPNEEDGVAKWLLDHYPI